ncbi:hypothetical protein KUL156_18360 [Alteromonas sp. KUL156]|nr:hypothetical protein KUL154_44830 [Alteromonas sp. KUL154]GFD99243.1 hypothetical protein KUL156_18360 [Alteromonas sp. KUL156]
MSNLAALRNSELLQYEFALGTGRTVANLLSRTKDLHGNTDIFNAMESTGSSSSPVKWLGEDEFLEASITSLKQASRFLVSLEKSLDMSVSALRNALKGKRGKSRLGRLFPTLKDEYWARVTKAEILPLLTEYRYWLYNIDDLELGEELTSAQSLLTTLEQPLFSQLNRLADIAEVSNFNWQQDQKIFENILTQLESDNKSFIKEWLDSPVLGAHYNARSHRMYDSLFSWLFLSLMAQTYGFTSNLWATKKQWGKLGCTIDDDAKPAAVFHYFNIRANTEHEALADSEVQSFGRKISIVYNADQVQGFDGSGIENTKVKPLKVLDKRIDELGVSIEHTDAGKAYYDPDADAITMPNKALFKGRDATRAYYATLLHEMVHWTGHETRCNRNIVGEFGSPAYAFEELVAEIGSSFLCARFGLMKGARVNSVRYIANWLSSFNVKKSMAKLEQAARKANQASNYIYIPKRDD